MAQLIGAWDTGIKARWYRSTELTGFTIDGSTCSMDLVEEKTAQNWRITFNPVQGVRWTAEECIWPAGVLEGAPEGDGFYEVFQSDWLRTLGKGSRTAYSVQRARHFIVCCYDQVIEVAAWGYEVTKLDQVGYPEGRGRIELDVDAPPPADPDALSSVIRHRLASFKRTE